MTDKEILDEVYRKLCFIADNKHLMNTDRMFDKVHDMKDLIEQEWQKQDEPNDWYSSDPCTTDVKEIERRNGLELDENGTTGE
tara:strand:- start:814 stop:1062 length:249 start_codon:yes stop_codon:yes gene_type:complete